MNSDLRFLILHGAAGVLTGLVVGGLFVLSGADLVIKLALGAAVGAALLAGARHRMITAGAFLEAFGLLALVVLLVRDQPPDAGHLAVAFAALASGVIASSMAIIRLRVA